jgi:predicted Zn finger-like uncharacterized protein
MPQEVLCPICGAAYNLADEQIGKKVRCKKCEHAFTAGGAPKHRDRDDDDDEEDERPRGKSKSKARRSRDRDEEEEERKPKKTKSLEEQAKPRGQREPGLPVSSFVIMGVVIGVLVLCCGGGGLFFWLVSRTPNPAPRPNPQPFPPNRGGRRAEVPAVRPAVAWLRDAEATRRAAGAAVRIADLMGRETNKPTGRGPWA